MKEFFKKFYLALVFLFLYGPIAVLMVFSFNDSRLKGSWVGFTFKWYKELLHNEEILSSFKTTILIAILATIIATILGTIVAIGIYYLRGYKKTLLLNMNYLPVLNPDIVTAVSLMVIFNLMNFPFGFFTMLLSHITFTTPYVILAVLPKLSQMNKFLPEAAMDMGASPFYTLRKVVLPEIKTGVFSGSLLAFTLSIDDFVISFFTTGHGVSNLSVTVYSMAKKGVNPAINALSTIMFLVMVILLLILHKRTNLLEEL